MSETPMNFRSIARNIFSLELSSALSETYAEGIDSGFSAVELEEGVGESVLRVAEGSREEDEFMIACIVIRRG